jgi:hypothetical protein
VVARVAEAIIEQWTATRKVHLTNSEAGGRNGHEAAAADAPEESGCQARCRLRDETCGRKEAGEEASQKGREQKAGAEEALELRSATWANEARGRLYSRHGFHSVQNTIRGRIFFAHRVRQASPRLGDMDEHNSLRAVALGAGLAHAPFAVLQVFVFAIHALDISA